MLPPSSIVAALFAVTLVLQTLSPRQIDRSIICVSLVIMNAAIWHIFPGRDAILIASTLFCQATISISFHCLNNECTSNGMILFVMLSIASCAWALLSSSQAEDHLSSAKQSATDIKARSTAPSTCSSGSQTDLYQSSFSPMADDNIRTQILKPSSHGGKLASVSEVEDLEPNSNAALGPETQMLRKPPDRDKRMSFVALIQRSRNSREHKRTNRSSSSFRLHHRQMKKVPSGVLSVPVRQETLFRAFSSSNLQQKIVQAITKASLDLISSSSSSDFHHAAGILFSPKRKERNSVGLGTNLFASGDQHPPGSNGPLSSLKSFRLWATNPHPDPAEVDSPRVSPFFSRAVDKASDFTSPAFSNKSGESPNDASLNLARLMSARDSVDSTEELEKALSLRKALDKQVEGRGVQHETSPGRRMGMEPEGTHPTVKPSNPFVFAPAPPSVPPIAARPPLVPSSPSPFLPSTFDGGRGLDTVIEEPSAQNDIVRSDSSSELLLGRDSTKANSITSFPLQQQQQQQQQHIKVIMESNASIMSATSSTYQRAHKDEMSSTFSNMSGNSALPNNSSKGPFPNFWAAGASTALKSNSTPTGGAQDDLEDSILSHRRLLDEKCALLEDIFIDKILGFGSMGMVYYAKMWDHQVVVKLIEHGTGLLGKEQNRGRLARVEAAVSRMLVHPNVVITYDCCTGPMDTQRLSAPNARPGGAGGRSNKPKVMTVMVQEFCEGGTLRDAINKQSFGLDRSSPEYHKIALRIALDIANGMRYLSTLRILHLDLKAENVLLQKMPIRDLRGEAGKLLGGFVAKVADFGLAQVLPFGTNHSNQGIHGTVSHMPPEVMGQEANFSFATDVYSFGVLLFELVTGGKPFHGMAAYQVVEAVVQRNERPVWPEESYAPLRDLAERCVERDPTSRPSFFEIVEELRDLLDPSLAAGRAHEHASECNSISNESDELEAALHQQKVMGKKLQRAAASVMGKTMAQSTVVNGGEEMVVDQGPPKDPLGRMLYFLSTMPAFSLVQKTESEYGSYWSTLTELVPLISEDKKQLVNLS